MQSKLTPGIQAFIVYAIGLCFFAGSSLSAQETPQRPKITGVSHVGYFVSDLSKSVDQRRAAELTLRHLHQLGHRQIAFMRGGSHSSDADDRWKNLKAVARELDLEVKPELTVLLKAIVSTPELGFEPTCDLLNRNVPFTALVCYNDIAAIGAMRAIRDYGMRVPEDISVVGFDDIQSAAFQNPSFTTIRQPLHHMGTVAA